MADETNNHVSNADPKPNGEHQDAHAEAQPPLIDEYGEPLGEEHEHARKRRLYKRPGFLIGAIVLVLLAAFFGIRYWLYARSHESTDDAFIDGHIVQVS